MICSAIGQNGFYGFITMWRLSLQNDKIVALSKLKTFADEKINVAQKLKIFKGSVENNGERRKCWLPAFSLFPTVFKRVFLQGR